MSQTAGGKENTHDRPSGCHAEQDNDRTQYPRPGASAVTGPQRAAGAYEREQEPGVEDKYCRTFDPAPDCVPAHRKRSYSCDQTQRKEQWVDPGRKRPPEDDDYRNEDEQRGRDDVRQRQRCMPGERRVDLS